MSPRLAQGLFVLLNVLAVPLIAWGVYEPVRVLGDIRSGADPIPVDTGIQYLILMSVFWVMMGIQLAGLRGHAEFVRQWGSRILVGWFLACILFSIAVPRGLHALLEQNGYQPCPDPAELSRLSVGASLIYVKEECPS